MKFKNLSKGTLYFPLKANEDVTNGAVYEIVDGKAQIIGEEITGNLVGVCVGGDNMRPGFVMLDIDPTAVFVEGYDVEPTIGSYVDGCKLVVGVDTDAETFSYLLRLPKDPDEGSGTEDEGSGTE